ncbi:methyltransferase [Candidatus Gottesmanbacteria bacterium RIFCSPLOWO2_01_FULL_46_21]|uniref:Methyltransferase n=1 Tax=Candidatus Gottesmanbacteria bacterium RIFCSPLOWO2_01_FULL_46_21 TaxID=1798393 RepID=A0A1F6AYN8_9BACT|nr:MAG: methyltransferase [Candidatus Gottesmanbacteria bacterium RIFCSPLOWO2_01_FULL_46_21]
MKLHLGCGKRYIPGFVHVDLGKFPHIDYQHDIASLPMFKKNCVDLIYSSHGIEYFDRDEVPRILKEWHRVLAKGGILRLAMPDFEALVRVYKKYNDLELIIGPLYGRWKVPGRKKMVIYHKAVYNFTSLKTLLESCGFKQVRRYDWRKTIHKNYDDFSQSYIPHMDKDTGILISLNVEARKA